MSIEMSRMTCYLTTVLTFVIAPPSMIYIRRWNKMSKDVYNEDQEDNYKIQTIRDW